MKSVLVLILLALSLNAMAVSLDELMSSQEIVEITPVTVNRLHLYASKAPDFDAADVCYAMGFNRVVSYEKELCTQGEKLSTLKAKEKGYLPETVPCTYQSERFSKIVCAKKN